MIRPATSDDMVKLAYLIGELGYPTTEEEMKHRMEKINSSPEYKTLVKEKDGKLVGMIGMILGYHYENNDNYVRIVALVVDSDYRNQGIGEQLMDEAEKWAKQNEATKLVLNSGNRRERHTAHRFYIRRGFEAKATGFYKRLI
ncbi:GNAT family N-acetyltransferase [Alkalibacillus aidingensis]|uniref:GNAT family N-acetyltransferase n=1 Tax=Alkalibacillus aidingensis TaxID=2747607 RepID=UPI0016603852|nr:GNAT family N-acetyltransferase [Alkalibacillus aidingensis]